MSGIPRLAIVSSLFLGLGGCGAEAPPAHAAPRPVIGAACRLSSPPPAGSEAAPPRVFLEVAGVEGDLTTVMSKLPPAHGAAPTSGVDAVFDALAADPRTKGITVQHVLVRNDALTTLPWDLAGSGAPAGAQEPRLEMRITPHVVGSSPPSVRMEVAFVSAPDPGTPTTGAPPAELAHTTVVVREQETIVLGGLSEPHPAGTPVVFAVTPYVVWGEADLERILECKKAARAGHAAAPPAGS